MSMRPVVELLIDDAWTDITDAPVYYRDRVTIGRGRSDESSTSDPSTASFTVNNRDGKFSPENPLSPYYGKIGRNTRCRISKIDPTVTTTAVWAPGDGISYVGTPDTAALDITGDIDIRVDLELVAIADHQDVIGKFLLSGNQRSWVIYIDTAGCINLLWSTDGSANFLATSTVQGVFPGQRTTIRVTLDVNNGASGRTATFYTGTGGVGGSFTQLGNTVVQSGTTSIFSSSANLNVMMSAPGQDSPPPLGKFYAAQVRNGLAGTVVANPDFTAQTIGAASFVDSTSKTWTLHEHAEIINASRIFRFHGEASSWPVKWDTTGRDVYVQMQASGISRRLQAGKAPLRSTMYRAHTNPSLTRVVAYWPCEDASGADAIASGLPGAPPMVITQGTPELAADDGWHASAAVPAMQNGRFSGVVPPYTPTGQIFTYMFVWVDDPVSANTNLFSVQTTGTARTWNVTLTTAGGLIVTATDDQGNAISATDLGTEWAFGLNSEGFIIIGLALAESGSNVTWAVSSTDFTANQAINTLPLDVLQGSGTVSSKKLGRAARVVVGNSGGLGNVKIGHIVVSNTTDAYLTDVASAVLAYNGERPDDRANRLADEEQIPFYASTNGASRSGNLVRLGHQLVNSYVDLLQEGADADLSILFEPRDMFGLAYRMRLGMYNQTPALTLDYSAHELADALNPMYDDLKIANDITVQRINGGSYRVEQTDGPLAVGDAPDGVGRYPAPTSISLSTDAQLVEQAGWRLHLGTVDGARYPTLALQLSHESFTSAPALLDDALKLDVGDRLVITNPPAWLPPDDISLIVQGYDEAFDQYLHEITLNCVPESPQEIGIVGDAVLGRVDTDGSSLSSSVTSSATSISVATTAGAIWTTSAADFPFDIRIGGEVMTVTNVTGSSSPQTMTVTRSVNGVVKAQSSGEDVRLAHPTIISL